jgi:long-chain fatty acid transport protein
MRKYTFGLMAAACVLAPQFAFSAGFALREHSADAMGSAYAGASATATDSSYLAYNPAAAGFVDQGDFTVSLAGIFPNSSADYTATTSALTPVSGEASPNDFISDAAVPALTARWRLADRWAFGLSVTAPWGLSTQYPNDWVGRYYGLQTKLLTVNIAPVLAFNVTPHVVIAGGVQAQYAHGQFSNAIDVGTIAAGPPFFGTPGAQDIRAKFDADGWGWGYTLGAIAQVSDALTLGVSYRSSVDTGADGTLKFNLAGNALAQTINGLTGLFSNSAASTSLTTPAVLNFGARWRLGERWTLLGEANWTDWTSFKELRIKSKNPANPDDVTLANWDSAWFYALGVEYQADDHWTLRAGTAFDGTPVPDATRGPRIPDNDRTWIAAGARYHASDCVDVSFSTSHLFLPSSDVHLTQLVAANAVRGNLDGRTKGSVDVVAVQVSFKMQ